MIYKLSNLISPYRYQTLISAMLAVLLLEYDAWSTANLALFSGNVLAGDGARNGEDCLVVLGIWLWKTLQVRKWKFGIGIEGGGGGGGGGGKPPEEEDSGESGGVVEA